MVTGLSMCLCYVNSELSHVKVGLPNLIAITKNKAVLIVQFTEFTAH